MSHFGEKLRYLRLKRGLAMRELADAVGFKAHGFRAVAIGACPTRS
jgi:transcriptional regulator with XRE-family HTH domain